MNDPWRRLENPIAEQFQRSGPEGRRLGRRVPAEGVWLSWDPVRTGRVRRRRRSDAGFARVVDLSISGALVEARSVDALVVGSLVTIGLEGASGQARVRRLGEELDGRRLYGVEFVALDPALKERINELVLGEGRSLEQRWRHAR